jgi:hypothetical protein
LSSSVTIFAFLVSRRAQTKRYALPSEEVLSRIFTFFIFHSSWC